MLKIVIATASLLGLLLSLPISANEIIHYRTPSPAERITSIPITNDAVDIPPIQRKVVASLAIGNLEPGDIVQAFSSVTFTNDVHYLIMVGTKLVLADNDAAVDGTRVGNIGNQNIDHYLVHHLAVPVNGSITIDKAIKNAHLNYVAYSVSYLKSTDAGGGIPVYVPGILPTQSETVIFPIDNGRHPTWGALSSNVITVNTGGGFISATVIRP